jgi:hypothetical protein
VDLESLPPQVSWALKALTRAVRAREPAMRERVRQLQEENPHRTPDEQAALLIERTRRRLAGSAAASGAVAIVPGLGTLAALSATAGQGVYALEQEVELVMQIAILYGHEPTASDERTIEALVVVGIAGGAIRFRDGLLIAGSERVAAHLVATYPQLLLSKIGDRLVARVLTRMLATGAGAAVARAAPLAIGMALGASFDWIAATALGRAAMRYYGPGGPASRRLQMTDEAREIEGRR